MNHEGYHRQQDYVYGTNNLDQVAPEFLLQKEIASVLNGVEPLETGFLNISAFDSRDFNSVLSISFFRAVVLEDILFNLDVRPVTSKDSPYASYLFLFVFRAKRSLWFSFSKSRRCCCC